MRLRSTPTVWRIALLAGVATFGLCGQSNDAAASATQQLHQIGVAAREAVLQKDWKRLLQFEENSNRSYDESFLEDKKDEHYCYLFDTNCIPRGMIKRSVFDILSNMRTPAIMVMLFPSEKPTQGRLYFYDSARFSEVALRLRTR